MRILDAEAVAAALDYPTLVPHLRQAFRAEITVPLRHHHTVSAEGGDATLLLMPAWQRGAALGVKVVGVFPGNGAKGLPAVHGSYLLLDGATGQPRAMLDGTELTLRRTAAASALAGCYLAKGDAARLLVVGTGRLARQLARAYASIWPLTEVRVWGRDHAKAAAMAAGLVAEGIPALPTGDLAGSAGWAEIVSCATLSQAPLIQGAWLSPGCHLDLVGGFTPAMREADDEAIRRASVFVDTRTGACQEAGDIVQPLASGALRGDDIAGDLFELCRGEADGRRDPAEITLFKSVGTALEDLAAAQLVVERAG